MKKKIVFLAAAGVAVVGVTGGIAAPRLDDDDRPLSGSALEQASAAALKHTGGGTVVDSEAGDDGGSYEVEIRLPDGSQVEVNLDGNFAVTGQEADDDSADGSDDDAGGESDD